jgi:hypothetical protein
MSPLIITLCAQASAEVEYVCSSLAWSAGWFVIGWVVALLTVIASGGRK